MTRKRRSFTPEFKQEAASLVLDQGYTIAQACTSLGVGESASNLRLIGGTAQPFAKPFRSYFKTTEISSVQNS